MSHLEKAILKDKKIGKGKLKKMAREEVREGRAKDKALKRMKAKC